MKAFSFLTSLEKRRAKKSGCRIICLKFSAACLPALGTDQEGDLRSCNTGTGDDECSWWFHVGAYSKIAVLGQGKENNSVLQTQAQPSPLASVDSTLSNCGVFSDGTPSFLTCTLVEGTAVWFVPSFQKYEEQTGLVTQHPYFAFCI